MSALWLPVFYIGGMLGTWFTICVHNELYPEDQLGKDEPPLFFLVGAWPLILICLIGYLIFLIINTGLTKTAKVVAIWIQNLQRTWSASTSMKPSSCGVDQEKPMLACDALIAEQ